MHVCTSQLVLPIVFIVHLFNIVYYYFFYYPYQLLSEIKYYYYYYYNSVYVSDVQSLIAKVFATIFCQKYLGTRSRCLVRYEIFQQKKNVF